MPWPRTEKGTTVIRLFVVSLAIVSILSLAAIGDDPHPIKIADCPVAVKKTLEHEAKGAHFESLEKLTEDGATTYEASVTLSARKYHLRIDAQGLLIEMGLQLGDDEVKFTACPAVVQATFRKEAKDAKFDMMTKDLKYGVTVYEAIVPLSGKEYTIVVAENGTLIEKMLIIAEDEIELSHCPAAVQHALKEHAQGGNIGPITRATGIGGHVFEADLEIKGKNYFIELTEGGGLISKSLLEGDASPVKP